MSTTFADLVARAQALAQAARADGSRRVLGITGAPGAGKSTLTGLLMAELGTDTAAFVPMDGFHLSNATLVAWGRRDRKGAPDTFDADGYVHLLGRLRARTEDVIHVPDFDRGVDQSIGSALPVRREVPLIVTEGNYLLSTLGAWADVAGLLDESWFLQVDDTERRRRLAQRHESHGMTPEQATAWAGSTDQANADVVGRGRDRADLVITDVVT